MTLFSKKNLLENLRDKTFRDSFVSTRADRGTAFQIRYLREKNGLTQAELARLLGTSQNAVWRLESPNYGRASISTLKRLASIFDVALIVRFVRYSELASQVLNQDSDFVTVDSFDKDYRLWQEEAPAIKPQPGVAKQERPLAQEEAGNEQERVLKSQPVSLISAVAPKSKEVKGGSGIWSVQQSF